MKLGYKIRPGGLLSGIAPTSRRAGRFIAKKNTAPKAEAESIEDKVEKLFSSQDLLFERLDAEPKLSVAMHKSLNSIRHNGKNVARYVHKQPIMAKVAIIIFFALSAGGIAYRFSMNDAGKFTDSDPSINEVAGVNNNAIEEQKPTTAKPSFEAMTPGGDDIEGIERETPNKDKIYTFIDDIDGTRVEVTQQKLPDAFKTDRQSKLAELAKSSYMSNIVQVDDITVYHGLNDESGIQSLVFIKNELLVFVKADKKIIDDAVVGFVLDLQ